MLNLAGGGHELFYNCGKREQQTCTRHSIVGGFETTNNS